MRKSILMITALMLVIGCSSEPIDVDKLVERGGLHYDVNSDKPYSGEVVWYYENGQKEGEGTFKDGKLDGLWTYWYEDGQKRGEGTFKNGKWDGKWTRWSSDGEESSELFWKDGKEWDGKWTFLHEDGQKRLEGTYKDGERISAKCWDEDGNEMDCPPSW